MNKFGTFTTVVSANFKGDKTICYFVKIKYLHFDIVNYSKEFPIQVKEMLKLDVQVEVNELYENLYKLLGQNKGDGFDIKIIETRNEIYVSIVLNVYESFHENPDYSYIVSYINSLSPKSRKPIVDDGGECRIINFILSTETIDQSKFEKFKRELTLQEIEVSKINHTIHGSEQGAGGWWEMLLLGISTKLSVEALKAIVRKVSNDFQVTDVKILPFDYEKLLEKVAEITQTSKVTLQIFDFEELSNQVYAVTLGNRYEVFTVKCDYKGNIIYLKTSSNSQTRI